jgi:hypothetical protein
LPDPESPLRALVAEEVDVDACALGLLEPGWAVVDPPVVVEVVDPVLDCAEEPPVAPWPAAVDEAGAVEVELVDVFVAALELPEPD